MNNIQLYSYDACPFAQRSRMVLEEKGLDFELVEVDVFDKPAGWSEISPYGKVPVLRHAGASIYESTIINEYLDEVFPQPALLPADPFARAQARIWMDYCDNHMRPAAAKLLWDSETSEKKATAKKGLDEALYFLEREGLDKTGRWTVFLRRTNHLGRLPVSSVFRAPCALRRTHRLPLAGRHAAIAPLVRGDERAAERFADYALAGFPPGTARADGRGHGGPPRGCRLTCQVRKRVEPIVCG